jgi:hypothetical protein
MPCGSQAFVVCGPPPPPPLSPSIAVVLVAAEELQEKPLALEEELTWREEALAAWQEKARIFKKPLVKVSADLDAEWVKTEATRKEYIDKMEPHIAHAKHSLGLDKLLGVKKVHLDERERDLDLCEAPLVEAQSRGLNPWDNHAELMEFIELHSTMSWRKQAPSWNTYGRPMPPVTIPRTRCRPFPVTASFSHLALILPCLLSSVCEYLRNLGFR